MQPQIQQKLKAIIIEHGTSIINDPRRIKAMLKDQFPNDKREVRVLSAALDEGFTQKLLRDGNSIPTSISIPKYAQILHDDVGVDLALAQWAVETWAMALSLEMPKATTAPTMPPTSQPTPTPTPTPVIAPQSTLMPTPTIPISGQNNTQSVRPWIRFWAKFVDLTIFGFLIGILIAFIDPSLLNGSLGNNFIVNFIMLVSWIFVDPLLLVMFGTTIGKWFFKIHVTLPNQKLTYSKALKRSGHLWVEGLGFGIISLITLIVSYERLTFNGITPWDNKGGFVVTHGKVGFIKPILAIILFVIIYFPSSVTWIADYFPNKTEQQNENQSSNVDQPSLDQLAQNGDAEAQLSLGLLYLEGKQLPQDDKKAFEWIYKSALQHNVIAEYAIGVLYEDGRGINQNNVEAANWYQRAAEKNDYRAQYKIGSMYEDGRGVSKNLVTAFNWYRKSAEQGYDEAQANLGLMYAKGSGVSVNDDQAIYWYKKAADQNHAHAQFSLGVMNENGWGIAVDKQKARDWYQKAANQGHQGAKDAISRLKDESKKSSSQQIQEAPIDNSPTYSQLDSFLQEYQEAENAYEKHNYDIALSKFNNLSLQGYAKAQHQLGWMYARGTGVTKNEDTAAYWIQKSAEQNFDEAQNSLGWLYDKGQGVPQSYEKAAYWYQKAADQGNAKAQNNLGWLYYEGQGVSQDYEKAFILYAKSAEQGYAKAQEKLGTMLHKLEEPTKAVYWFQKAADQDNSIAQHKLAGMYSHGWGIERDDSKALYWYQKAAKNGVPESQFSLGYMYENGIGIGQDNKQAIYWYKKAEKKGNEDAKEALQRLQSGTNRTSTTSGEVRQTTFSYADELAGKAKYAACAGCHGPNGRSASPAFPSLAGKDAAYLKSALNDYKYGNRHNPMMSPQAKGLSDTDIENLAAFLASQR